MNITNLQLHIKQYRSKYEQGKGQLALLKSQRKEKKAQLDQLISDLQDWELVKVLFAETSEFAREQLKKKIENTVTAALQSIIDDSDLKFKVEIDRKANQPVAEWKIISRYGDEYVAESPENARGGGISDIVSIALRLASLELARPQNEGILTADEPGKHVSAEYAPNLAAFLKEYSEKTRRQSIMITHNRDLAESANKRYEVGRDSEGNSGVKEL
ncbi:MAG: ATP-binding protein [Halanaerobiales bacterium]|nr:ATP-binding protein [Halanaerobiales bacterium]